MKQFFGKIYSAIKVLVVLSILGITFYSGMYFVSSNYDTDKQKEIMSKSIAAAFANTESQPIIMIVPKYSLLERSKKLIGMDVPEREIIEISTAALTRVLFKEEIKPGLVSASLLATGNGIKSAWNSTVSGTSKAWNATKNGTSWAYNKAKFWDHEDENKIN